jgi:hypothetical protein
LTLRKCVLPRFLVISASCYVRQIRRYNSSTLIVPTQLSTIALWKAHRPACTGPRRAQANYASPRLRCSEPSRRRGRQKMDHEEQIDDRGIQVIAARTIRAKVSDLLWPSGRASCVRGCGRAGGDAGPPQSAVVLRRHMPALVIDPAPARRPRSIRTSAAAKQPGHSRVLRLTPVG